MFARRLVEKQKKNIPIYSSVVFRQIRSENGRVEKCKTIYAYAYTESSLSFVYVRKPGGFFNDEKNVFKKQTAYRECGSEVFRSTTKEEAVSESRHV